MEVLLSLFYIPIAIVWVLRSRCAFKALRQNPEVKPLPSPPRKGPLISILLPVKNEEVNIEACLETLLQQDYPATEIIVINDHSIDRTPEILSQYMKLSPKNVRVIDATATPSGWTGKNWALAEGVQWARGEWLLFTDADTRHEPWSVSSAVFHAQTKERDLLTLSPRCLTECFWERVVQPAAMAFTGLSFPFYKVNDPSASLHFGNGQYLLIRNGAYKRLGGHERVKGEFLEDFALVREAKKLDLRIECAIGTRIYGTRMYRSFGGVWAGWRRIFFHAFEKNPYLLLRKAVSLFVFSSLPFFYFIFFPQPVAGGVTLGLIVATLWKTHEILGAPGSYALLHPLAGLILAGILLDAASSAFQKKELKWR